MLKVHSIYEKLSVSLPEKEREAVCIVTQYCKKRINEALPVCVYMLEEINQIVFTKISHDPNDQEQSRTEEIKSRNVSIKVKTETRIEPTKYVQKIIKCQTANINKQNDPIASTNIAKTKISNPNHTKISNPNHTKRTTRHRTINIKAKRIHKPEAKPS